MVLPPPAKFGLEGPGALCRFLSPMRVSSSDWACTKVTEFSPSPAHVPVCTSATSSPHACRWISPVKTSSFAVSKEGTACSTGTPPILMLPITRKDNEDCTVYLHGDPWQGAEDVAMEDLDNWLEDFYSLHAARQCVQEPLLSTLQEPAPFFDKNSLRGWGTLENTGWHESPDSPPDFLLSTKSLPAEMPMYSMSRHLESQSRGIVGMVSAHSSGLQRSSRRGWDATPSADNRLGIGGTEGAISGLPPSVRRVEVECDEMTSSNLSWRSSISEKTTASSCTQMSNVSTASSLSSPVRCQVEGDGEGSEDSKRQADISESVGHVACFTMDSLWAVPSKRAQSSTLAGHSVKMVPGSEAREEIQDLSQVSVSWTCQKTPSCTRRFATVESDTSNVLHQTSPGAKDANRFLIKSAPKGLVAQCGIFKQARLIRNEDTFQHRGWGQHDRTILGMR